MEQHLQRYFGGRSVVSEDRGPTDLKMTLEPGYVLYMQARNQDEWMLALTYNGEIVQSDPEYSCWNVAGNLLEYAADQLWGALRSYLQAYPTLPSGHFCYYIPDKVQEQLTWNDDCLLERAVKLNLLLEMDEECGREIPEDGSLHQRMLLT